MVNSPRERKSRTADARRQARLRRCEDTEGYSTTRRCSRYFEVDLIFYMTAGSVTQKHYFMARASMEDYFS